MAYHESGHAVIAYILGVKFKRARLTDGRDDSGLLEGMGLNPTEEPDSLSQLKTRQRFKRQIFMFAAGDAAESLIEAGHVWDESGHDFNQASELAEAIVLSPDEMNAYLTWVWHRTRTLLELEVNWNAVKSVTSALLKEKVPILGLYSQKSQTKSRQ